MRHPVINAQRTIPNARRRRYTGADIVHLIRRALTYPGAIGIFISARLVGDFKMIKAVIGMSNAMISVGVRQKVKFADIGRSIAVRLEHSWQSDDLSWNRDAHAGNAQSRWILTREHTDTAGHTDRILYKMMTEVHAAARQGIQIGSLDLGIAIGAQRIPTLLIGIQYEDIGSSHVCIPLLADLTIVS